MRCKVSTMEERRHNKKVLFLSSRKKNVFCRFAILQCFSIFFEKMSTQGPSLTNSINMLWALQIIRVWCDKKWNYSRNRYGFSAIWRLQIDVLSTKKIGILIVNETLLQKSSMILLLIKTHTHTHNNESHNTSNRRHGAQRSQQSNKSNARRIRVASSHENAETKIHATQYVEHLVTVYCIKC